MRVKKQDDSTARDIHVNVIKKNRLAAPAVISSVLLHFFKTATLGKHIDLNSKNSFFSIISP